MKTKLQWAACAIALAHALSANAAITYMADENGVLANPELVLALWDPVAKVSYTRDLGLSAYTGQDPALRAESFWVRAQQDSGYQNFWSLDAATDPNYARFRQSATNPANIQWTVMAIDVLGPADNPNTNPAGGLSVYSTIRPTDTPGAPGSSYSALLRATLDELVGVEGLNGYSQFFTNLNQGFGQTAVAGSNAFNSHRHNNVPNDYAHDGSSFDQDGDLGYLGRFQSLTTLGRIGGGGVDAMNPVGNSSWFYRASNADEFDVYMPLVIDEFDNLTHDGYWGVAVNPADGKLVLSYTLEAATLQSLSLTVQGLAASSMREYMAGSLLRHINGPDGEFAGYTPPTFALSPVPEPSSALLAMAGLAALLAARRKRPA